MSMKINTTLPSPAELKEEISSVRKACRVKEKKRSGDSRYFHRKIGQICSHYRTVFCR